MVVYNLLFTQVPQGHMVQQILDPNGTLQHVILTPEPMLSQHQPPPQSHHGVPITPYVSIYTQSEKRCVLIFFRLHYNMQVIYGPSLYEAKLSYFETMWEDGPGPY